MTTPEAQKQEQKMTPPAENKPGVIPAQYEGMPSEVVEKLWQSKVYSDPEKNNAEAKRRQIALEAIKQGEADRETAKQQQMSERYSKLPPEQKTEFPTAQTDAGKILNENIQGKRELDDPSPEESFVLGKLKTAYEEFKRENPDKPFAFELSRDIDQNVYNNLVQRVAFKVLEGRQRIGDQEKANEIRKELGVPAQEIQTEGLLLPNKEGEPQQEQKETQTDDYGNFDYGNAETAPGVWWNAYDSKAAKKLKKEGKFQWGKERIYFDIPTDQMETLRDLTQRIAQEQHIPIAFKHLDTSKSEPWASQDETRFVANFASVEDAKKFYEGLRQSDEYQKMKSDRNFDYHGHNIDGVAHYASGYREQREPLKRAIETAKRNPDGTYTYKSPKDEDIQIEEWQYEKWKKDLAAIPDPKETWEKTKI